MEKHRIKSMVVVMTLIMMLIPAAYSEAMMDGGGTPGSGGMMNPGTMPMPSSQQMFSYGPMPAPVMGTDMAGTMPIGVGSAAMGGSMLTVHATVGQFAGPMDMYFTVYAPAIDPFTIFMVHPDGSIQPASMGVVPFMHGVTGMDQDMANMPVSMLPMGTYTIGLMATPSGSAMSNYYLWMTSFEVN